MSLAVPKAQRAAVLAVDDGLASNIFADGLAVIVVTGLTKNISISI